MSTPMNRPVEATASSSTARRCISGTSNDDNILPEYDFTDGVHGKHYQAYREGHTVKIHRADGSVVIHAFDLEEGAVMPSRRFRSTSPIPKV